MTAATAFALRVVARLAVRRPSFWLVALLWLGVLWSSTPPGLDPADSVLGSWVSLGLGTPSWFAVELAVFHLVVVADLFLAVRAAGILLYGSLLAGRARWTVSVVAVAVAGAMVHVASWCAVTALKCWRYTGSVQWSLAADETRRLPGDTSGVVSTALILLAAVLTLATVSLLVAAVSHVVASSLAVVSMIGLWCVIEIPLTSAEFGLMLARQLDPAVVGSPDSLLLYAHRPDQLVPGVAVLGAAWVVAIAGICGARRFRAISAPGDKVG